MEIRYATLEDLEAIAEMEAVCFPAVEAASKEAFAKRLEVFPNHFWLLEKGGILVGMINGLVTDVPMLRDEMFANAKMHNENGDWQMVFGVETLPEYRKQGCATMLMNRLIKDVEEQGRKGIFLTCKQEMIPFYKKFGYINEGKSMSKHGGAVWYDMRLML